MKNTFGSDLSLTIFGESHGRAVGAVLDAIALMIENQNTRSGDYAKTADLLRPGHADFTAYAKYHGFQDARGGGHFSGRVTAALVAGGSIVLAALQRAGIDITTHIARCAGLADTPFALDDPAALAAQVETLASKTEGFAVLDTAVEEPMKAAIRAAGAEGAVNGQVRHIQNAVGNVHADGHDAPDEALCHSAGHGVYQRGQEIHKNILIS